MIKTKVMIVEDEGIIAMEIKSRLKKLGYNVVAVSSTGNEAITKAVTAKPDIVLMDIILKGRMNGIESAHEIYRKCAIPVVYLTAHADEKFLQKAKKTESYGYILKPFNEDAIRTTMEMALSKHSLLNELKRSQSLYRGLVETSQDLIFRCDTGGRFTFLNQTWEKITGYKLNEMLGKRFAEFKNPEAAAKDMKIFKKVLSGTPVIGYETHYITKTGEERFLLFNVRPLLDNAGKSIGTHGTAYDITDRKKAEEEKERLQQQVLQSEKMAALGEIAAGIAHEINTPLNVILGYQELMQSKIEKCPEFKEFVDISIEEVDCCKQLINDFLFYAKPSSTTAFQDCSLASIVNHSLKLSAVHKEIKINIQSNIEKDLPLINGDQRQIIQVFMNLINNAIHAMPNGGTISISIKQVIPDKNIQNKNTLEFCIRDTGEGIPKEHISKVFDPFFTSKRPGKGTGLGLAVCQRIMENHRGKIWIESEQGKGTSVIGHFPVAR